MLAFHGRHSVEATICWTCVNVGLQTMVVDCGFSFCRLFLISIGVLFAHIIIFFHYLCICILNMYLGLDYSNKLANLTCFWYYLFMI